MSAPIGPASPFGTPAGLRVVALGGGTGLPVVLRGLKGLLFPTEGRFGQGRDRLTAIVSVADDGGSSGRLRRSLGVLPPGDIRNCLLSLSEANATLAGIFEFRFEAGDGLEGHSLGNLILAALSRIEAPFSRAVERAGELLAIRGQVYPATSESVTLWADLADGSSVCGESRVGASGRPIRGVRLEPSGARALPEACEAVARAGLVVIGPGSLYTSLLPILLVEELAEALAACRARVVLVMNLMTEPGETDGLSAADHVRALRRHAPRVPIHDVLVNGAPLPGEGLDAYTAQGARPIVLDPRALQSLGCRTVVRDVVGEGPTIRHDPHKLARAIWALAPAFPEALAV